jgi:hypothetical protein
MSSASTYAGRSAMLIMSDPVRLLPATTGDPSAAGGAGWAVLEALLLARSRQV